MYLQPFQVSLETLIGAAPLLGHALEDRGDIRQAQDWHLLKHLQQTTSTPLRSPSQEDLFCVAPLDVLVTENDGRKQFHIIEINGTGIGGLTNLTGDAVSAVLDGLQQFAQHLPGDDAVVLVASSGKEAASNPRQNKLLHEKILYAEALKRGFDYAGLAARVFAINQLAAQPSAFATGRPAIVLGYMKDFLEHLQLDGAGRLRLFGRAVHAAVNDRFCLNVVQHFQEQVELGSWHTLNRGFLAGADKGVAYALLNEFAAHEPQDCLPTKVHFSRAANRAELTALVLDWLAHGRRPVIKPQGTGLGHGIRFFLSAKESADAVCARIDDSLRETEEYYGLRGGAFPYTVCEFLDTSMIAAPEHPLRGHKFEVRIAVYRDGNELRAFPSIAKIASAAYNADAPAHLSLINNITTSAQAKKAAGVEFMLPLCRRDTLATLGLTTTDLHDLCYAATRFMRFSLDRVEDDPAFFGLPATAPVRASAGRNTYPRHGVPLAVE